MTHRNHVWSFPNHAVGGLKKGNLFKVWGQKMATLSLTPRETSSGLRPPRFAAPQQQAAAERRGVALPHARGAIKRPPKDDDFDRPATPTREVLRQAARMLHERRSKAGAGEFGDATSETLAEAIRQRTSLTLQQANAAPGAANVTVARQAEVQRQQLRLEDLRRTFDLLHAEFTGKDELRRLLEYELANGKEQLGSIRGGGGGAAASGPTSPPAPSVAPPTPLDAMTERVRIAQEELNEMLHACEVLAYMEQRTRTANNKAEANLDQLKRSLNNLEREDQEIRALGEDASDAVRNARKQLVLAREAHANQQRAYEDCKAQRKTVISDKRKGKEREKALEERERAARLDGLGELDRKAEEDLKKAEAGQQLSKITAHIEKEAAAEEVSKLEEVYNRLRRATHDPESIATPQDLYLTMVSAKDRSVELQSQVDKTEELSRQLTLEVQKLQAELQNYMYYGGSSQAMREAEGELEPGLEEATTLMEARRKKCNAARGLVHESKIGLALLLHLTHHESLEKLPADGDIPAALDRVERHLVSCLATISQAQNPQSGRSQQRAIAARLAAEAEAEMGGSGGVDVSEAAAAAAASEAPVPPLVPHPP